MLWATVASFACSATNEHELVVDQPERGPLGKADAIGSCENHCGDRDPGGNCWCDDLCVTYGDCCEDVQAWCVEAPTGPAACSTFDSPLVATLPMTDLTMDGDIAFGRDGAPIEIVDLSDPTSPVAVVGPPTGDALVARDGLLYAQQGNSTLVTYDIAEDGSLEPISSVDGTIGDDAVIDGDRLVSIHLNRLHAWDLSDPGSPVPGASLAIPMGGRAHLRDDVALVVNPASGLLAVDVSDAEHPRPIGGHPDLRTRVFALDGPLGYAGDWNYDRLMLETWDLSDVSAPERLGSVLMPPLDNPNGLVVLAGDRVAIGNSRQTLVVQRHAADDAEVVALIPAGPPRASLPGGLLIAGNQVVDLDRYLSVLEPALENTTGKRVAEHDGIAYVAHSKGLTAVDLASWTVLGTIQTDSTASDAIDVAVTDGRVVVARSSSLEVYDVTNPAAMVRTATRALVGPLDVEISGSVLFASRSTAWQEYGAVDVFDISSGQIELVRTLADDRARSIAVQGELLATVGPALRLYDIGNPEGPVLLSSKPIGAGTGNVHIAGSTLVYRQGYDLRTLDITNPSSPADGATYGGGSVTSMHLVGEHLYVLGKSLEVFRVTDSRELEPVFTYMPRSATSDVLAWGTRAFLLTSAGLQPMSLCSTP